MSTDNPNKVYKFKAVIESDGSGMDTAFIKIPLKVKTEFGSNGQVKVMTTFDGHAYRGVIANMGTGFHMIGVRKDVRKAIGKQLGDVVQVTIAKDLEERIVEVPPVLHLILSKNKKAKNFFDSLSYTNRKEYVRWISEPKKEETQMKRLKSILVKLLGGKRNPSEK